LQLILRHGLGTDVGRQPDHESLTRIDYIRVDYIAGSTTEFPSRATAVCANSLPSIEAPVRSAIDV